MTVAVTDLLPIELIRKHLRVDYDGEDDLITLYAESAMAWALWYCDNPALVLVPDFPASFKSALLLLLGESYLNREPVAAGATAAELHPAVDSLLWASRNWRGVVDPAPEALP